LPETSNLSAELRMTPKKLKPDAAPIRDYHATLKTYADHDAVHEGATETAFSNLLAVTSRPHGWT
jgi:hypothetical protein